jgi:hypothetical protein
MSDATHIYLGDGVYARFDGYNVLLAVMNHRNEVLTLEPEVMLKLIEFADKHQLKDRKK